MARTKPKPKRESDDPCPCGSDEKFKKCCKGKDIEWEMDEDGNWLRLVPVEGRLEELVGQLDQEIYKHFERERLNDDPLMPHTLMYSDKDTTRKMIEVMEKVGTNPAFIYAYKKVGILLTEEMAERAPGSLVEEWDNAVDEYYDFGGDPEESTEGKQFDQLLNALIEDIDSLIYLFGLVVNKYFNSDYPDDIASDGTGMLSPTAYIGLNVARSQRVLRSIKHLLSEDYDEDALKLARSLYENYLHILLVKHQPENIVVLVDAKYGLRDGSFKYVEKNGKEDRRRIVCCATGTVYPSYISGYKMAEASGRRFDAEFYDVFYQQMSDVVHPSIFNVKDYVRNGSLDPLDSDWKEEAVIYSVFIGCLVAVEIKEVKYLPKSLVADCGTVSRRLLLHLSDTLDFLKLWTERIGIDFPELNLINNRLNDILNEMGKKR